MYAGVQRAGIEKVGVICCALLASVGLACAQSPAPPRLQIHPALPGANRVQLSCDLRTNAVVALEASTNLVGWEDIAIGHDLLLEYPDLDTTRLANRYYRSRVTPRGTSDDWKNQLFFPTEPFRSTNNDSDIAWVKFSIVLSRPDRVYYQDSRKFPLHYEFAIARLPQFRGMDYAAFNAASLHRDGQHVVLGAVLYPPGGAMVPWSEGIAEYGIQFDGLDAYTPDEIAGWFDLVKATVHTAPGTTAYYMPSFEQLPVARAQAEEFRAKGIPVASADRWTSGDICYSAGWALGRLKSFPASEIRAAFGDGRLCANDILLTDGVPPDTPVLAGIISLTAATPNSHTVILLRSYGLPFVYLADTGSQARAQQLTGHKILLRATKTYSAAQIKMVDLEAVLPPSVEAELLAMRAPEPIEFVAKQTRGAMAASVDQLGPSDIRYFGGKAAHFGLLRRSIPNQCPTAIAFSFDLWDEFLNQVLPGGKTLRAEIETQLGPVSTYPPDMLALKSRLAAVRDLFTKTASVNVIQREAIFSALSGFDPRRKIRFRSSTNLEDSEHFSGAGLYDSFSGCLADDLDADAAGPCQCDSAEPDERGVFRALQKVYASFYNDDAFLERLRYGVDESKVAMAVLVHYSFPDEDELANGVATPCFNFGTGEMNGDFATQLGACSVTNPNGTAAPEVLNLSGFGLAVRQWSSLMPLGAYVMEWPGDYTRLTELFRSVGVAFRQAYPGTPSACLDFEFKKDAQLGLMIKQVRRIPQPSGHVRAPFLIDEPATYEIRQYGSALANHRLKSLWNLRSRNLLLSDTNLAEGLYGPCSLEYLEDGRLRTLTGPMSTWPNASQSADGSVCTWTTGTGARQWSWQLQTTLTRTVSGSQPPVVTLLDFPKLLSVTYPTPLPQIFWGTLSSTTNDTVALQPVPDPGLCGLLQQRTLATKAVRIETSYYWAKPPGSVLAISWPLLRFSQSRISGLTTTPILLTNYYSQTYGAFVHNYMEEFLFEPGLEPGLPAVTLQELKAANIELIYATASAGKATAFYLKGFGEGFRPL